MLTISGAPYRLCNGVTRRDALRIGTAGIAGLSLSGLLQSEASARTTSGKARSLILVHLGGGPSHVDTYDPKPEAPVEIRGEFKAIATKVDGIQFCELFPLQAAMADRLAVVRSITRVVPEEHSSSHTTTGWGHTERFNQQDRPSIGAVLAKLRGDPHSRVPAYVSLRGYDRESGLGSAYLGPTCEPFNYQGPGREDLRLAIGDTRLENRRRLLEKMNGFRHMVDSGAVRSQDVFAQRALEIVARRETYTALDIAKESDETRKRYANQEHFLRARRLIEAGVRCVAIEYGGWDTHEGNFRQLRNIMPPLDQAVSALLSDLKDRGLDQETLVVLWGEFGRTPRVNGTAGRDHWPQVMSAMIAGGGLRMGQAIGATDAGAADAADRPLRVRNVMATLYHALGIDPHTVFIDNQNRPQELIPDFAPIPELIG